MKRIFFLILFSYTLSSTHFSVSSSPYTEAEQKLINEVLKERKKERQKTARLNATLMNFPMTPKTRSGILGYFTMYKALTEKIAKWQKGDSTPSTPLSMPTPKTPCFRSPKKEPLAQQRPLYFFNTPAALPISTPRAATAPTQTIYNNAESWWREISKDKYCDFICPFIIEQDI